MNEVFAHSSKKKKRVFQKKKEKEMVVASSRRFLLFRSIKRVTSIESAIDFISLVSNRKVDGNMEYLSGRARLRGKNV